VEDRDLEPNEPAKPEDWGKDSLPTLSTPTGAGAEVVEGIPY
jgi:hypothetical protein